VVPRPQRLAEEVFTIGDRGAERQFNSGTAWPLPSPICRQLFFTSVSANKSGTNPPARPAASCCRRRIRVDPVVFRAQGDGGAVAIRVVEAQPALRTCQSAFSSARALPGGIARGRAGDLGLAVLNHAQRAGTDDLVEEGLAAGC